MGNVAGNRFPRQRPAPKFNNSFLSGDLEHPLLKGVLAQPGVAEKPKRPEWRMPPMPPRFMPDAIPVPVPAETPQSSAERFRQANRGLPDGVRFEPIDDETKAALEKLGKAPAAETEEPQIETQNDECIPLLERLIQDERNASLFYAYLSGIAPSEEHKHAIQEISRECENRSRQYNQILQSRHNRSFDAKEPQINMTMSFSQGVQVAITEERKILEAMAALIESLEDAQTVQNMLNKRLIKLSFLQSLAHNFV